MPETVEIQQHGVTDGRERCTYYGRYSSARQKRASIADQFRNCQEAADEKDWVVIEECIRSDEEKSGTTLFGRQGIQDLIALVKQQPRPFDIIVIDESSRLGRRMADVFHLMDIFDHYGVRVYFVSDDLMSGTEWFRDAFTAKARADEQFSKTHGKRVRRGRIGRFEAGFNPGGGCYGYRNEKVYDHTKRGEHGEPQIIGMKQVINPEQAHIVRRIWNSYADGMSDRQIATMLNDEQIPPPQSTRKNLKPSWSQKAICVILSNERYRGFVTYGRTIELRNPETGRKERRDRPQSTWKSRVDPDLQIISDQLFARVQERRRLRNTKIGIKRVGGMSRTEASRKYLFSGLLKCGLCGGNFVVRTTNPPRYGCANHVNRGICTNKATIRQQDLEEAFIRALSDQLRSADLREGLIQVLFKHLQSDKTKHVASEETAEQERKELEANLRTQLMYQENLVTAVKQSGGSRALCAELVQVEGKIGRIQELLAVTRKTPAKEVRIEEVREFIANEIQNLEQLLLGNPESLKEYFQRTIDKIILTPIFDERGLAYRITGDVDLFTVPEGVMQRNQVDLISLHHTIPVSIEVISYRNRPKWAEVKAA